jgi:hypothetical protein
MLASSIDFNKNSDLSPTNITPHDSIIKTITLTKLLPKDLKVEGILRTNTLHSKN